MANFIRKLANSSFNVDDTEKILNSKYTNSPTMENHILLLFCSLQYLRNDNQVIVRNLQSLIQSRLWSKLCHFQFHSPGTSLTQRTQNVFLKEISGHNSTYFTFCSPRNHNPWIKKMACHLLWKQIYKR